MTPPMDWKTCYETEALENSNLRKELIIAAKFMPPNELAAMRQRLTSRTLNKGGAVKDSADDRHEEQQEIKRLCVLAADMLQEIIDCDHPNQSWYGRADSLASKLREYDPPAVPDSLIAAGLLDGDKL